MFFLIIWLVLLTAVIVVGFLMVIGKFARIDRDINALVSALFDDEGFPKIEKIHEVFEAFLEDFKNLKTGFENLQKTSQYDNATLAGSMEQIENRIAQLQEDQKGLRADLEKGYEERPVTAELVAMPRNKGGRPTKGR